MSAAGAWKGCAVPVPGLRWQLVDAAAGIWFHAPSRLRSNVRLLAHCLPALLGRNLPLFRLRGPAYPSRRPATLVLAGVRPWADYLPRRFFSATPGCEPMGRVPMRLLPGVLGRLRAEADLTVARVDRLCARMFFGRDYLRVPEWIGASLELPADLREIYRRSGNLREDLRRIRSGRLRPLVSRCEADFDFFYETMYLPHLQARHGDLGAVTPPVVMRQWFRQGGILFAERDGERLAGSVFIRRKGTFYICSVGAREGRRTPLKLGALAALWVFGNQHALDLGCRHVQFGTSRALLQDGVLRFKSKWGVRFSASHSSLLELLLHWNRFDAPVADFFAHSSPVFRCKAGLAAVHVTGTDQACADAARRALWIDGIDRLHLAGRNPWPPGVQAPPRCTLLSGDITPVGLSGG